MPYQTFTTARTTVPEYRALFDALRLVEATIGIGTQEYPGRVTLKKSTAWTAPEISQAQVAIDTTPVGTPQSRAVTSIDHMPMELQAIVLSLVDSINELRAVHTFPPITPTQAMAAIRTKAGGLTPLAPTKGR